MIVFELVCPKNHRFEGWFASADDFDSQKARGLLSCPNCGDGGIRKLLTAKIGKSEVVPQPSSGSQNLPVTNLTQAQLHQLIDHVLKSTEDVGSQFAAEARRIHREEAPQRAIRGVASGEETKELLEEGVPVLPLPIPDRGDWH
jgi:hypothetical protein